MKTKDQLIQLGIEGFKADEIMLLQERMLEQAVKFQFRKKDNSTRDAIGTLDRDRMLQEDGTIWKPVGESKPEPASIVRFWDVEAKAWRCFDVTRFIGLVEA